MTDDIYRQPDQIAWREGFDAGKREADSELKAENARFRTALELIAKNKTEDRDIYTMGCDCDEVALTALGRFHGMPPKNKAASES